MTRADPFLHEPRGRAARMIAGASSGVSRQAYGEHRLLTFATAADGTVTVTESGPGNDREVAFRKMR